MAARLSSLAARASRPLLQTPANPANRTPAARRAIVAPPQTPSAPKAQRAFDTTNTSKQPNLTARMFSTRNLCILAIGSGAVAAGASFAALTAKVGALGASQLIAMHVVAFLQPGVVVTAFALKAGATVTMSAAMPVILPIASTVLIGGIGIAVVVFVAKKTFSGAGMVKDAVLALPKKLVEQIPGGKTMISMISYFSSEGRTPTEAEVEEELLVQHQALRERAVEQNKDADVLLPKPGLEVIAEEKKESAEEKKQIARERGIVTRRGNSDFQAVRTHQPGEMARRARTKESLELSVEPTNGISAMACIVSAVFGAVAIGFALSKTGAEFGDVISEL